MCADFCDLNAHRVSASWPGSAPVIHEVDLSIPHGVITALVGPNGSGKSTLLRALSRLHPIDSGKITVREGKSEHDIHRIGPRRCARKIAMLTQHRPVPAGITVREVVAFGRNPHTSRFTRKDPGGAEAIDRALEVTGLHDLSTQTVDSLSGGQRQRAWLASCLAQNTPVLLLDEPTNHLDMRHQVELLKLLSSLAKNEGKAIGVVLHDLNQAAAIADRVALLDQGVLRAVGSPTEVLTEENITDTYSVAVDIRHAQSQLEIDYLSAINHHRTLEGAL